MSTPSDCSLLEGCRLQCLARPNFYNLECLEDVHFDELSEMYQKLELVSLKTRCIDILIEKAFASKVLLKMCLNGSINGLAFGEHLPKLAT